MLEFVDEIPDGESMPFTVEPIPFWPEDGLPLLDFTAQGFGWRPHELRTAIAHMRQTLFEEEK